MRRMGNLKEHWEKVILAVTASGIAFSGAFGPDRAAAQGGGDEEQHPDTAHAQVVPEESLGNPSSIAVIEDPGEAPPLGEEELAVGESFYLGSIEQEVTVMYADRYMRLLMPDEMGGDPRYYQPIENIEVNPEYTSEQMEQNIWSFYWPQVYLDLIQNGRTTQDGRSYADELGLQGNITREAIWEVLQARKGNWPLIPYRYKWGSNGQEDLYAEGYANPNLPINVIPLPRYLTPPAFGNEPVKPWIRIDSYQANTVVPNSAIGVLVNQETGQINLYSDVLKERPHGGNICVPLYRIEAIFTTENGIRHELETDDWEIAWWRTSMKDFDILLAD